MDLLLLFAALFLFSIFVTNWPVKIYHYLVLKRLADLLEAFPEKNGLFFSNVYSQINTIYKEKEFKIRFMEASIDSLKANSGLEIRLHISSGVIMEFYPLKYHKHEWGDFKRFLTGDPQIDARWLILTTNKTEADTFWNSLNLRDFLTISCLAQILLNQDELIIQLKNWRTVIKVKEVIEKMVQIF